ncbi:MAG: hypothetical protein HUJ76_05620 [Parasporobacterium sp.]|nr:hypothetical protein [Parasporobacterium sp.]
MRRAKALFVLLVVFAVTFTASYIIAIAGPRELRTIFFYIPPAIFAVTFIGIIIIAFMKEPQKKQEQKKPANAKEYSMNQQEELKRVLEQINKRKL